MSSTESAEVERGLRTRFRILARKKTRPEVAFHLSLRAQFPESGWAEAMLCFALACGMSANATVASAVPTPGAIVETPFVVLAPGVPASPTLFTELSPAQTGVVTTNDYSDPQMWGALYHEYEVGEIGTGIAIGDYDGDGLPDIFVVSKTESCRLFRNLGNFKFEDVTDRSGVGDHGAEAGIWKQGATFVDINNDGRLDLYVCRFNAPNLLYINQGDGRFKEMAHAYGLDVKDASGMAAFCDYDRDGLLDVFIHTNLLDNSAHPNGQRGYLFHHNRDGTFTDVTAQAGISGEAQTHSATWWDFDNDGWPDLYLANDFFAPDRLYRNNRDGTFSSVIDRVVPHTPYSSMGSDLGDVNNDGLIDLIVGDMAAPDHVKDQRTMVNARSEAIDPPEGSGNAVQLYRNALYLNTGTGRFQEAAFLAGVAATGWSWALRLEDLDNDGRLDLFVTNGMHREVNNADLLAKQMSTESPAARLRVMRDSPVYAEPNLVYQNKGDLQFTEVGHAWGLDQKGVSFGAAFGDLNGDGFLDLVYANFHGGVTLLRNNGTTGHRVTISLIGTVSNHNGVGATVRIESASGVQVRQLTLARGYLSSSEPILHFGLGADTLIKRLTVNWLSGEVQTFTDLAVDHRLTITEPSAESETVAAALRRDSFSSVVAGGADPGPASAGSIHSNNYPADEWRGLNGGTRPPGGLVGGTQEKTRPEVAFHPIQLPRSASTHAATSPTQFTEVSEALGLSHLSREAIVDEIAQQRLLPLRFNRRGPALAVGDADGDGRDDLVIAGTTESPTRGLRCTDAGGFTPLSVAALAPADPVNDGPVLLFDAAGLGRSDLLVTKGGNSLPAGVPEYQPALFLNDGHGGFQPAPANALPELPISVGAAAAADFTHNGRLGLFLGGRLLPGQYPETPPSALLLNRGGRFEDVTDAIAPGLRHVGLVTAALWSDIDGDGWSDLLLALDWGEVKCFRNEQGRSFEDWTQKLGFAAAGTGWWTSLASADFNGDGRPDYVVGNLGLNTQYHADATHPARLYSGDFNGDGEQPQLVEAHYEGDRLYPWRSRLDLGASIPSVLKRFPSNNRYASATLDQIIGQDKLTAATKLTATEFRSGVFMSQPDGTYRFEPLPRIAQIAPTQGVVAGDFDGDGHADIFVVQNSFAPIAAVGRFDGGISQLLRGDGRGQFTPAPPAESGLVVSGDAKALVVIDLDHDGWPDFVTSRNNATTLAFRNRGIAGRHMFAVRLRGLPGNPTAIGARITVELSDGVAQTSEVSAGGGYSSQSSAVGFFGYPEGNPPRRVRVRWPLGSTSEQLVPAAVTELVLTESVK